GAVGGRVAQGGVVHVVRQVHDAGRVDADGDDVVVVGDFGCEDVEAGAEGGPGGASNRAPSDDDVAIDIVKGGELEAAGGGQAVDSHGAGVDVACGVGVEGDSGKGDLIGGGGNLGEEECDTYAGMAAQCIPRSSRSSAHEPATPLKSKNNIT